MTDSGTALSGLFESVFELSPLAIVVTSLTTHRVIEANRPMDVVHDEMGHDLPPALWGTITESIARHARRATPESVNSI